MGSLLDVALADGGIGSAVEAAAERLRARTVWIRSGRNGAGAGVLWSEDGLVVTNAHVASAARVEVRLPDGQRFQGEVVAADPWRDLAAVRIPLETTSPSPRARSASLRTGDLVLAMGHPLGWDHSVTLGILHAVERIGGSGPPRWIRADVTLMPGNSGGPLADADGRVIGLNALVANGLAFAVPVEAVDALLDAQRPRLGVALQPAVVRQRRRQSFGMVVVDVAPGSAAAVAGIRPGDVVRSLDRLLIAAPSDIAQLLHAASGKHSLSVGVVRDGRSIELDAELRPDPQGARAA